MNARILVVDSDPWALRIASGALRDAGFAVETARSGRHALECVQADIPDLIVTELTLPEMDGRSMIQQLRRDPRYAAIPVMVLTQLDKQKARLNSLGLADDDYLSKPFRIIGLQRWVETKLSRVRTEPPTSILPPSLGPRPILPSPIAPPRSTLRPPPSSPLKIFVSYASEEQQLAERLAAALRAEHYEVFFDRHSLDVGEPFHKKIRDEIRSSQVLVFLISPRSVASDSYARTELKFVEREWTSPATRLIPVMAQSVPMEDVPPSLRTVNMIRAGESQIEAEVTYAVERFAMARRSAVNNTTSTSTGSASESIDDMPLTPGLITARLDAAYQHREELIVAGKVTTEIDTEILNLRREQRNGPVLHVGEFLSHGRFRLIEVLGQGGFATVWKAYDRKEHQPVAIKVLHGQFVRDDSRRKRLFRGARKMAELQHPNIVRVLLPRGEDQGFYYYVMEYVPGGDLHQAILEKRVDTRRALEVIEATADALAMAHEQGEHQPRLVHRDIKPHNILLRADGRPALTDFDLVWARDTTAGSRGALGTVIYAAPEQLVDASKVDHRADIYSLGMTAVFCVHGEELPLTVIRQLDAFLKELRCSEALRAILQRAVAFDPDDRFQSMTSFRHHLLDCLSQTSRRASIQGPAAGGKILRPKKPPRDPLSNLPQPPTPSHSPSTKGKTLRSKKPPRDPLSNLPQPPPGSIDGHPARRLSKRELAAGVSMVQHAVKACGAEHGAEPGEHIIIEFTVTGTTGTVLETRPLAPHADTALGHCAATAARNARFATFEQATMTFQVKFTM